MAEQLQSDDTAETGGTKGAFVRTRWSQLAALRGAGSTQRQSLYDFLIRRYWKPVLCFLLRKGYTRQAAEELTEDFFAFCFEKNVFSKADASKGHFRSFMLKTLEHFVANAHRAEHAAKRRPEEGFVSIQELATSERSVFEPVDRETPEVGFHRTWLTDLVFRVLRALEQECRITQKEVHYELFRQRIVLPALEGSEPPPLAELAQKLGLAEKQAANFVMTARRAYQRLLRQEIRLYARTDDEVAAEVNDLFHFLGGE